MYTRRRLRHHSLPSLLLPLPLLLPNPLLILLLLLLQQKVHVPASPLQTRSSPSTAACSFTMCYCYRPARCR